MREEKTEAGKETEHTKGQKTNARGPDSNKRMFQSAEITSSGKCMPLSSV